MSPVPAVTVKPVFGAVRISLPPGLTATTSVASPNSGTAFEAAPPTRTLLVFVAGASTMIALTAVKVSVRPKASARAPARSRFSLAEAASWRVSPNSSCA